MEPRTLSAAERRLLTMILEERGDGDNWTAVSRQVWPLMETLPARLVELEASTDKRRGGSARLTPEGYAVVAAMEWL